MPSTTVVSRDPELPRLLPPYLLVLIATALLAAFLGSRSVSALEAARESRAFEAGSRREISFGLAFEGFAGIGLAVALALELLAAPVRLARRRRSGRVLARLLAACLPLLLLVVVHLALAPGTLALLGPLRSLL